MRGDMNIVYLYYAFLTVCGGVLVGIGPSNRIAGNVGFTPIFLSISGLGMVGGVIHEICSSSHPIHTVPDNRTAWFTVTIGIVGVIAAIWSQVG